MKEDGDKYVQGAHPAQQMGKFELEMPIWDYPNALSVTASLCPALVFSSLIC